MLCFVLLLFYYHYLVHSSDPFAHVTQGCSTDTGGMGGHLSASEVTQNDMGEYVKYIH